MIVTTDLRDFVKMHEYKLKAKVNNFQAERLDHRLYQRAISEKRAEQLYVRRHYLHELDDDDEDEETEQAARRRAPVGYILTNIH